MNTPGVISLFSSYNSLRERAWELGFKEGRESLIAGSYAIFWLHCPRWTTGGGRGGNDEIALTSKNVASILYHAD